MDSLQGMLLIPPDRTQILGRASWKPRYVVVGSSSAGATRRRQGSTGYPHGVLAGRASAFASKPLAKAQPPPPDEYHISVYKSKDDSEPVQQWPASCVADCQVQLVSNRKQGPVLPTLVVTLSDKDRRRRSSRAAGLISANKDSATTTLWFRTPPDDHHPSLHNWARFILSKRGAAPVAVSSDSTPASPAFTSPFSNRSRGNSDNGPRPTSSGRPLHHKSSTATYSTAPRDRPATFSSASPSLRSKRSDISSPSSNNHNPHKVPYAIPEQHYATPCQPGEHGRDTAEGWPSAYGPSSGMSSPGRGQDSVGSQSQYPSPVADAAAPPAPGETILDRAFQLGQIPGAEAYIPGQEKLSSIARFDALMCDVEERKKRKEAAAMRSAFEDDDSSDSVEADAGDSDVSDSGRDAAARPRELQPLQDDDDYCHTPLMSPSAQRALAYIAGRHDTGRRDTGRGAPSHRPAASRTHLSFHDDPAALALPRSPAPISRPHTAHPKSRPSTSGRAHSAPRLANAAANPMAADPDIMSPSSAPAGGSSGSGKKPPVAVTGGGEKRLSGSSAKRLAFTEFAKRLSSTSSLLLVQTNASAGSSEAESQQPPSGPRTGLTARGARRGAGPGSTLPPPPPPKGDDADGRRCSRCGNMGLGVEGGFL